MILLRWAAALAAAMAVLGVGFEGRSDAAEVIKLGTLAPKASPWGKVFTVWEEAVKKKSDGKAELQFFYNGTQGDEGAMVGKMKAGQLDGAAVTAVGLAKIYKPILALQTPGLFTSWAQLDKAREALKGEFEKGMADAGFRSLGWADVGSVHMLTKGFAVRSPSDLRGKKPMMWRDDLIQPVLYQVIGVTPIPLNVPEVLPQLSTGAINVVNAPSLAAEQLQWSSKLDHVVDGTSTFAIGALVVASKRLDALPADLRQIIIDTGKVAASALTSRIRSEDASAYERLKSRMTVITLTPAEEAKWRGVFNQMRQRLIQGTFPPELVARLEELAK